MLHFIDDAVAVVEIDPQAGGATEISRFEAPDNWTPIALGVDQRQAANLRSRLSPDLKWIALGGAHKGYMDASGHVVELSEILPPASDFGYERTIELGRFGTDGRYYFRTQEDGVPTYWAARPETNEVEKISRSKIEAETGGTALTGKATSQETWRVPDRSGTSCLGALDIRAGQCLFGARVPDAAYDSDGRLEVWSVSDDAGVVNSLPGGDEQATSVVSIVPPNDRACEGGVFSPDGSQVAFLTAADVSSVWRGDLYVVDVNDKTPRKLSNDARYVSRGQGDVWRLLGWR